MESVYYRYVKVEESTPSAFQDKFMPPNICRSELYWRWLGMLDKGKKLNSPSAHKTKTMYVRAIVDQPIAMLKLWRMWMTVHVCEAESAKVTVHASSRQRTATRARTQLVVQKRNGLTQLCTKLCFYSKNILNPTSKT